MDPLMLQPTWTTVMAIDLCDGRKYFVELQSFAHRTTGYGNIQGGAIDGSSHASANLDNKDGLICVMTGNILWAVVFFSSDYMYGYYQQVGRACDVHRGILVITQQMWILHFCYSRHVCQTASCEVAATYCLCTACMLVQKQLHIAIKAAFWYQQIASYQQMAS